MPNYISTIPNPQPPTPNFSAVLLSAGLGKRMKSDLPKVLHRLNGKPLIEYVVDTAEQCGANPIIAVVGYMRELVIAQLGDRVLYAVQEPQLGTGHAVQQTEPLLKNFQGDILILSGDVPLLRSETIESLLELHRSEGNACTLVTCIFPDPTGYGRIERNDKGAVTAIVEHKDASAKQRTIKEINSGIYVVKSAPLFEALHTLKNDNIQGEYYLTDIVPAMLKKGLRVGGLTVNNPIEIAGVNSIVELEALEREYLRRTS